MTFLKELLKPLYLHIKFSKYVSNYRKKNRHNSTFPINIFNVKSINVGKGTYGKIKVIDYANNGSLLKIGNYCSIADNVSFILNGEHNYKLFSTFPFRSVYCSDFSETGSKGNIVIEDDVWIGYGSIILSGVVIGKGSVIAAGSIVSKSVPPYSIYIKDKVYKKRFSDNIIEYLSTVDFSTLKVDNIIRHQKLFEMVDEDNIEQIVKILKSR